MAQNFVQPGDTLALPAAPYDLDPGDGCLVRVIFVGIAERQPIGRGMRPDDYRGFRARSVSAAANPSVTVNVRLNGVSLP